MNDFDITSTIRLIPNEHATLCAVCSENESDSVTCANLDTMRKFAIISRSNFDYLIEIKTMRCVKFTMPIVLNAHSHAIDSQRKTL